jgi:hypothetical protein
MGPSSWSLDYDGAAESTESSRESTRDLEHGSLLNIINCKNTSEAIQ